MQPTLCSRCKKNLAQIFISRLEGDKTTNEGLCLSCARKIGLPQVEEMMKRMGISEEDLETLSTDMMAAVQDMQTEDAPDDEDDDEEEEQGNTATFPFMNRLFNNERSAPPPPPPQNNRKDGKARAAKHKFLDNYCICLTERAKEGKLDPVIGREEEIERVVQILNRRQKNNPCLIGEPGVGKTAIAEGLAQRIANGDVPSSSARRKCICWT